MDVSAPHDAGSRIPRLRLDSAVAALREVPRQRLRLLSLLPSAGTGRVALLVLWRMLAMLAPLGGAVAAGWLIREIYAASGGGSETALVWPLVVLIAMLVLEEFAESLASAIGISVGSRIDGAIRREIRQIALAPTHIEHLGDVEFRDDVARASDIGRNRGRRGSPGTAAVGQVIITTRVIGALVGTALLATFSVPLAIGLLVLALTMRAIIRRQFTYLAVVDRARVAQERRMDYWSDVLGDPEYAKEVRVFGIVDWIAGRRARVMAEWLAGMSEPRRAILRRQKIVVTGAFVCAALALGVPGAAAASGRITAADLATLLLAAWSLFAMSSMGHEAFDIEYGIGSVKALDRLLAAHRRVPGPNPYAPTPAEFSTIRFENVSFTYPGGTRPVLENLSLEIRAGEVLAVVGRNGAGKTTLIKVLGGLYAPTSGRITCDGVDIAAMDPEAWRGCMYAVFQQFVRYPATVADNIGLAAPEHLGDTAGISVAATRAGSPAWVDRKAGVGLDTVLWRGTRDGHDLSGGQWQKLAMARALFAAAHGRRLLVLDEPTAHLDVAAEIDFYGRVTSSVHGAAIVLISHRLSTIRGAGRIVVLDGGRITESGTHDELIAAGGVYARMFELQAARFDTGDVPDGDALDAYDTGEVTDD